MNADRRKWKPRERSFYRLLRAHLVMIQVGLDELGAGGPLGIEQVTVRDVLYPQHLYRMKDSVKVAVFTHGEIQRAAGWIEGAADRIPQTVGAMLAAYGLGGADMLAYPGPFKPVHDHAPRRRR